MSFPNTQMPSVIEIVSLNRLRLGLADAILGPRLVDVDAEVSADSASCAGFFCHSHPLKHKNCLVDFVQLLPKMGNQCVELDLV